MPFAEFILCGVYRLPCAHTGNGRAREFLLTSDCARFFAGVCSIPLAKKILGYHLGIELTTGV